MLNAEVKSIIQANANLPSCRRDGHTVTNNNISCCKGESGMAKLPKLYHVFVIVAVTFAAVVLR